MRAKPNDDNLVDLHAADKRNHIKSLNRIKGQVEGVSQMMIEGRRVEDVLIQLSAVRAAVKSVERALLEDHIQKSVYRAIAESDSPESRKAIESLIALVEKRLS